MSVDSGFETRSSKREEAKFKKQMLRWNITLGLVIVLLFGVGIFLFQSLSESKGDRTYNGSRDLMSTTDAQEIDDYHIKQLKKIGVKLDKDNLSKVDVDEVLSKIDESNADVHEKINMASGFAGLMGNYYIENDQSKISEIAETLKNNINNDVLANNQSRSVFLLTGIYQSTLIDNSIPPDVSEASKLVKIDDMATVYRRLVQDLYRNYEQWNSDKTKERLELLQDDAMFAEVPQI